MPITETMSLDYAKAHGFLELLNFTYDRITEFRNLAANIIGEPPNKITGIIELQDHKFTIEINKNGTGNIIIEDQT